MADDALTLTITGLGPWERPATPEEAKRMATYVAVAERHGAPGRCPTCAFRAGTDANRSSLVVRCVENAVLSGGTFGCHHDPEEAARVCAGFLAFIRYDPPPQPRDP